MPEKVITPEEAAAAMAGGQVTCGVCGAKIAEGDEHLAGGDDALIDGAAISCGACHAKWRALLVEYLQVGSLLGRKWIESVITVGRGAVAVQRAARKEAGGGAPGS